jgi:hypothetical protein
VQEAGAGGGPVDTGASDAPASDPADAAGAPAARPVTLLDRDQANRAHDRLAEAIRLQRGIRGGGGSGPPSGGGRYALSEAA